jgi:CO/xanthine dehydrogenase Mo-binding subunit
MQCEGLEVLTIEGLATAQTQHAAERLGLPKAKVLFEYGDSSLPIMLDKLL